MRLQRVLADAGVAARRACEDLITRGRVAVNGRIVRELPAFVHPKTDRITVDGRPIAPAQTRRAYVLFNKPSRVLVAAADEPGFARRTVNDLVQHPTAGRLVAVGRLDFESTGLVLLTNDLPLVNRLTHPSFGVPRTYRALVGRPVDAEMLADIEQAINRVERRERAKAGRPMASRVELGIERVEGERTVLTVRVRDGRGSQVGPMLARAGMPVKKLELVSLGPLELTGVARGRWRDLERQEVRAIKAAARGAWSEPDTENSARTASADSPLVRRRGGADMMSNGAARGRTRRAGARDGRPRTGRSRGAGGPTRDGSGTSRPARRAPKERG